MVFCQHGNGMGFVFEFDADWPCPCCRLQYGGIRLLCHRMVCTQENKNRIIQLWRAFLTADEHFCFQYSRQVLYNGHIRSNIKLDKKNHHCVMQIICKFPYLTLSSGNVLEFWPPSRSGFSKLITHNSLCFQCSYKAICQACRRRVPNITCSSRWLAKEHVHSFKIVQGPVSLTVHMGEQSYLQGSQLVWPR